MKIRVGFAILIAVITACGTKKKISQNSTGNSVSQTLESVTIKPKNPYPIFRTSANKIWDIKQSLLQVRFDIPQHKLLGIVTHTMLPYGLPSDTVTLDSKNLKIDSVELLLPNAIIIKTSFFQNQNKLSIPLPIVPKKEESFQLRIYYASTPDEVKEKGSAAIREAKGLYFINGNGKDSLKPIQIWTQGETEGNSCWFPTIDKPNHKSKFELQITVPNEYTTLSNGKLNYQLKNGANRTDTWIQDKPMSAYLVMMAIGKFAKTEVQQQPLLIDYYVEPNYKNSAKEIFARTPEMINFFSEKLGVPFPWAKYSQVVCKDYVSGAMENTSASLFGDFVQKHHEEMIDNPNDNIVAHELFHQWFGDLVTCESWSNLFLNEGFASYGEYLWSEHQGDEAATEKIGYGDLSRYLSFAENNDGPIVNYYYSDKEDMFNAITYRKGSRVLHLLRSELGDDIFFAGIKKYLNDYAYQAAEVHDLRKIFEEVSGKDLLPFFQQWVYGGGHPTLHLTYDQTDSSALKIIYEQKNDSAKLFKFPLSFRILQNGQATMYNKYISKISDTMRIDLQQKNTAIVIPDAQHNFIGRIIENKSSAAFEQAFNATNSYYEKAYILNALVKKDSASSLLDKVYLRAISTKEPLIKQLALQYIKQQGCTIDKNTAATKFSNIAMNDPNATNRRLAFDLLPMYKNDASVATCRIGLFDSSAQVIVAALNSLSAIDNSVAYAEISNLKNVRSGALLSSMANVLAKEAQLKDTTFFIKNIPANFGGDRNRILNAYVQHAWKIQDKANLLSAISTCQYYATQDQRKDIRTNAIKQLQSMYNTLEASGTDPMNLKNIIEQIKKDATATEKDMDVNGAWKTNRKMD